MPRGNPARRAARQSSRFGRAAGAFSMIVLMGAVFALMLGLVGRLRADDDEQFYRSLAQPAPAGDGDGEPDVGWLGDTPSAAAWLEVEGTPISYPVAAAETAQEVSYYLGHRIDGTPSSAGSLVMDERSNAEGEHVMVYGHRMGWTGSMFGSLWQRYEPRLFAELGCARWHTPGGVATFSPLCALVISADDEGVQRFSFPDSDDVGSFALQLAERAEARRSDWRVAAARARRVLTLVTCTQPWEGTLERTLVVFCS